MTALEDVSLLDQMNVDASRKAEEIKAKQPAPIIDQDLMAEMQENSFLAEGVTVPDSQGLGAALGGPFLGGTVESERYINPFVKRFMEDNPDAFTGSDDNYFQAVKSTLGLFETQSARVRKAILLGEIDIPGFNHKLYDQLQSEGDVPANAEQKRIDAMVADDSALGPRFSAGESPLSAGDRFNFATLDTAQEKRKFFENLYPDGEFYIKEVGQSFEDPSQRATIEMFSTEAGGPLYQVDRFDYQNTFSGRGLVKLFTETKKAFEGDVEAKARIAPIYNDMGLDIVDVAGQLTNFQNLLPALVDVMPYSKAKAAFLRAASGITKGGAAFGLDKLGQWLDDATSLDEVRGEGVATTDNMESAMAGAFTAFGRLAGGAFGLLSGTPQGKEAFKALFLSGASKDQVDILRQGAKTGVPITVSNLTESGIMKRLLNQSQALSPELYGPVRKEQSEKLLQYLMDKVRESGTIDGSVTANQVGEIVEGMSSKIRKVLFEDPLGPTDATINSQLKAEMAGRSLKDIEKFDRTLRDDIYNHLLRSPEIKNATFDINTTDLRGVAKSVQEGVLGTQQKTSTNVVEAGTILGPDGRPLSPGGIEEVTETVVESIGGGPSAQLAKIAKELETALFDDPVASKVDSKTVFSVLEQVDAYKKKLAEIVDVTSSENRYVQQLQESLDGVWDQTLKQIDALDVTPEIAAQAAQAKWLSQYMTQTLRTGYIGKALQGGNTRPFENLIQPLLDGQKVLGPDDLAALTNLVQGAPANIPKQYLDGISGKIVAKMTRAERKKVVDRFRSQLKESTTLALQAEPGKLPQKILQITGFDDLSRTKDIIDNPNLKWFFPSIEERTRIVSQAQVLEKFEAGLQPFVDATKEALPGVGAFFGEAVEEAAESGGIMGAILSKLSSKNSPASPGQTSAQDIKTVFNQLTGDSRVAVKKQLQNHFLGNLLNEISKESVSSGATLGVAYNKVSKAIADLRGKNSPTSALYDWVMEDVPELGDVVSTLSRLSSVFKDAEDMGASIAAAAEASNVGDLAMTGQVPELLRILMRQKVMAEVFTSPVTLAQLNNILRQDKLGQRVKRAVGRLITKTATRAAPRNSYELDSLGDGVRPVVVRPMSGKSMGTSFRDLSEKRTESSPSGSRLDELLPGNEMKLFETIPSSSSATPRRASPPPKTTSSLGLLPNSPPAAQGGIATLAGRVKTDNTLAGLNKMGLPLFPVT